MTLIQILLGASLLGLGLYILYFRSRLRDRLLVLFFLSGAILAVIFPGATTAVANRLGVGRGADLLLYLFFIATLFSLVLLYSKISRCEAQLTALIRHLALRDGREVQSSDGDRKRGQTP